MTAEAAGIATKVQFHFAKTRRRSLHADQTTWQVMAE
jgi:uncharacterized protein YktB (UPF0637 family)